MNIALIFLEIIIVSISLLFFLKKYKYDGLYTWILIFSLIIGIVSQKTVEIFELEVNLGIVINSLMVIASNIIIQKKGPNEIKKIITIVLFSNLCLYLFSLLSNAINVSKINEIANNSFNDLFNLNTKTYFATIISMIVCLYINSVLYHQIRQIKNKIWITNILSTIIIHLIESTLFCIIAYTAKISPINIIELIVIRYIFKTIIGILGTNLIYISTKFER